MPAAGTTAPSNSRSSPRSSTPRSAAARSVSYMRERWSGEVDIRSIKSTMKMDVLRCKTPEMVEKEIWAYLLAYNLLRTVMAVAASENDVEPREISFKGAKQALTAFAPKLEAARPEQRAAAGGCAC